MMHGAVTRGHFFLGKTEIKTSYIIRHWRLVEMEGEIAKQTPQLNLMFSNPSPPRIRIRAGIELHGDFELPGNCRCVLLQ